MVHICGAMVPSGLPIQVEVELVSTVSASVEEQKLELEPMVVLCLEMGHTQLQVSTLWLLVDKLIPTVIDLLR
jgi:hypothetical protein